MRRALWLAALVSSTVASAQPADPYGPAPTQPDDPYAPPKPAPNPYDTPKPAPKPKTPPKAPAPAEPIDPTTTLDPYETRKPNPPPPPAPPLPIAPSTPPSDTVLAEQIAQSLVARAQELYDARVFVDAKQLALEALQQSPKGAAGEHARYLVRLANKQLGLPDQPLPGDTIQVSATAVDEGVKIEDEPLPPQPEKPDTHVSTLVHGGLYFGMIGAAIGSFTSDESPARGAVLVGLGGAIGGVMLGPVIENKLGWTEAQMRTVGSGTVWGGVVGAFMGDAVKKQGTTGRHVLLGGGIGSTVGGLIGAGVASQKRFTRGEVALVDTLAGIGAVGGLTLGMLMQPAQGEAYSVNAIVGATAGWVTGYIAGPLTDTTPRRMTRVVGASLIGGAAPFLLYAAMYDESSHADERTVGLLSTAGLVVGAYVGFRLTRDMAEGTDTQDGARKRDPNELGLVHRHASGEWALGTIGVGPLSHELAPQPGAQVPILGGTW